MASLPGSTDTEPGQTGSDVPHVLRLRRLAHALAAATGVEAALRIVAREAADLAGATAAHVWLADEAGRSLWPLADAGVGPEPLAYGESDAGRVAATRQPVAMDEFLGLPILADGGLVAVLGLAGAGLGRLGADDRAALDGVAACAALAVGSARLRTEHEAARRGETALADLGPLIKRALPTVEVADQIARRLVTLLDASAAAVFRLDPASDEPIPIALAGHLANPGTTAAAPDGRGAAGRAVRERHPIVSDDRAALGLPLIVDDLVIGAVSATAAPARRFTPGDVDTARAYADLAALALQKAWLGEQSLALYLEAEDRRREAEVLARMARAINESLDLDTVLGRVAASARELVAADIATILLRDAGGSTMTVRYWAGERRTTGSVPVEEGRGLGGHAWRTRRPVRATNRPEDPAMPPEHRAMLDAAGVVATLVVPIVGGDTVRGLIHVANRVARPFSDRDEAALVRLADAAATAIENARLFAAERAAHATAESVRHALVESQSSLERAQAAGRIGTWTMTLEGEPRLEWSPEMHSLFGLPAGSFGGTAAQFFGLVHPDDAEPVRQAARFALAHGTPYHIEYRIVRPDGSARWVYDQAEIVRGPDGRPVRMIGLSQDVTERREAEEAYRREAALVGLLQRVAVAANEATSVEEAVRRAIDEVCAHLGWPVGHAWLPAAHDPTVVAPTPIWHGGDAGRFDEVRRETESLAGAPAGALVDRAASLRAPQWLADVAAATGSARARAAARAGLASGFAVPVVVGSEVAGVLEFFTTVRTDEDPELLEAMSHVAAQIARVVERVRADRALEASQARYRQLVEASIQGIWVQRNFRLLFANAEIARMLGYAGGEALVGTDLRDRFAPHERDRLETITAAAIVGAPLPARHLFEGVRRDGQPVWFETLWTTVRWDGEPALMATVIDVSDRRAAQEALRRSEERLRQTLKMEALGRLAGGVAHDFNNLLTVIGGRADMLLDARGLPERARAEVELIQRVAERAAVLTRQLLAFSRKQVLQPRILDPNVVAVQMGRMLQRLIGEDIELVIVARPGLGRVSADRGQIEQALLNLAVNARDAMPRGGRLTIETANVAAVGDAAPRESGAWVMLAVTDTGVGMDAATRAHVFEPFFTTKDVGEGTGLGLATVYGIVEQSGGHVEVESERGRGATFRIYLPRIAEPAEPDAAAPPSPAPRGGAETILLVEDEAEVRALASETLEAYGYTVLAASDGVEALAIAEGHGGPIDLVVTDVVMPKMRGDQLVRALARTGREAKVVYMSGYAELGNVHPTLEPGADFIQKPFSPSDLATKVRTALDGGAAPAG